jgi:hypothetical protein
VSLIDLTRAAPSARSGDGPTAAQQTSPAREQIFIQNVEYFESVIAQATRPPCALKASAAAV